MFPGSLDGTLAPAEQLSIPVTDEGLLRGDGAFEVVRLYAGRPYALAQHLERLARTAAGIRLPYDEAALRAEIDALLGAVGPVDAMLRVVLTRGGRRIALVEPLADRPPVAEVVSVTFAPSRILDGLKTLSYAGNMLAGRIAKEQGAHEALLVTPHGRVLEGATWSLFWCAPGAGLRTPPLSDRILASITRAQVVEETGASEAPCTLADLRGATEAFIASTAREVMPIGRIDGIVLPEAPGPVTRDAAQRLRARIERELAGQ